MATKTDSTEGKISPAIKKTIENIKIGYVMPIAKTEGYPDLHWNDVMRILDDTLMDMGLKKGRIVSDGGEITTIHSRIVNNLNDDDIIICDVSSRNPNVMFELGMRIAFDKPVIIIKDDITDYCFDSGTIEHIGYPKDLRHGLVNKFQNKLEEKIKSTFSAYIENSEKKVSPILKNFGSFDKKDVQLNELSANESLLQDIQVIKDSLVKLQMLSSPSTDKTRDLQKVSSDPYMSWSGNDMRINLRKIRPSRRTIFTEWVISRGYTFNTNDLIMSIKIDGEDDYESIRKHLSNLIF